jgi:hypothetical protein
MRGAISARTTAGGSTTLSVGVSTSPIPPPSEVRRNPTTSVTAAAAASNRASEGEASMASGIMRVMARRGKVIPFPVRGAAPPAPVEERALVELRRCDQAEAVVVKSLLESEGIPALLRSRIAHSVHPFTVGAQGEVTILVPRDDLARRRRLLG